MKLLKIKFLLLLSLVFITLFSLLILVGLLFSDEDTSSSASDLGSNNLSSEVLAYRPLVEKYCKEFDISDQVTTILAIMQVESGGKGKDVMQSSESLGLPVNSLEPEASIKQGCKYFAQLVKSSEASECDFDTGIQAYNFGGGFISYVAKKGKKYSYEVAESFSKEKSGGVKVNYTNPIAVSMNGGWRYNYGNQFYVKLVSQYLTTTHFDDATVQKIMDEALKYQGFPYVFGGSTPDTSFDCSGFTKWCYKAAGLTLPRTAQQQYDAMQHLTIEDAKPGDLIFFHSTCDTSDYITHVGIFLAKNKMYHAGDPIGYEDISQAYWQQHFVGIGRIKGN
ncbi:peptidase P60 [Enterococcus faecalis]|nr:peptidase P60 [Enterococcus faecalis]